VAGLLNLAKAAGNIPAPKPSNDLLRAFHGSPYDFDKFSIDQIGTGEGAQAYGRGLYFAESEDVARGYKEQLTRGNVPALEVPFIESMEAVGVDLDGVGGEALYEFVTQYAHNKGDLSGTISDARRTSRLLKSDGQDASELDAVIKAVEKARVNGFEPPIPPKGRMYEVDIDASPDELIQYEKLWNEQPKLVQDALKDSLQKQGWDDATITDYMADVGFGDGKDNLDFFDLEAELASRGVKGVSYKDAFSRGADGGTSNYVIFDDRLISISKKYGIPIPAAAALLSGQSEEAEAGILGALKGSSRLQRAQEQGFDVDNPVYHGTPADNIAAFDDSKIGDRDEGFFGRGHYFADSGGEARYYGPNVNEYVVRGKMLNLDTPSSMSAASVDYERKRFKYQMGKLAEIDALDEPQKRGLQAVKDLEKYVDENVIVGRGINDDGSEGFHVRVPKPFLTKYTDGSTEQQYMSARPGRRGIHFNPDRKEAIENLKNEILYDILYNRSNTFSNKFKDVNLAMLSLADYVRHGGVGSAKLTEKAKQAGYDGIKVADETVVFDPKNIRHVDAQFDPAKTDSSNVLASGGPVAAGLLGTAAMQPEEAEAGPIAAGARRIIDPRFSQPMGGGSVRKGLLDPMATVGAEITPRGISTGPSFQLSDFEGQPYIISQSDRSAAGGILNAVGGTQIDPVDLRGGRDFMFENPGMAWASDPKVVNSLLERATKLKEDSGQNPLLLPYTMAPTGIDFATMPLDTMINFARSNMSKTNIKKLDRKIKKIIPKWGGVANPGSNAIFRDSTGDQRKMVADVIDKQFKDVKGGLSIAEARAVTSDANQYRSNDGSMVNIGKIDTSRGAIADSGHPTYKGGLPGEGVGTFSEPLNIRKFIANNGRVVTNKPSDIRAASMNPALTQGIIDEKLLRAQEGSINPRLLGGIAAGSAATAAAPTLADQGAGLLDFLANAAQGAIAPIANAPNTIIQALTSDRSNEQLKADRDARFAQNDYQLRTDLGQQYTQNAQQTIGGLLQYLLKQAERSRIVNAAKNSRILQTIPNAYNQIPERGRIVGNALLDSFL